MSDGGEAGGRRVEANDDGERTSTSTPTENDGEKFVVVWCLDAWHSIYDLVDRRLKEQGPRYELRMYDPSKGPLEDQCRDARVLIPTTGRVPAEAIDAARDLLLITQPASGLDNVDLEAARRRGVPVCNAPGVNAASVAEAAVMSLLMVARRWKELETSFRERQIGKPLGTQLRGKTLGLVGGRGEVGRRVSEIAGAIGMRVLSVGSRSTDGEWETLLGESDAISLHCPLTSETRHLIDGDKLKRMKRGVLLVNYSRGAVVDEAALLEALESGRVGGAALDVFESEPQDPESPLASHPRVVATPHVGVATREVADAYAELLVSNVVAASEGRVGDLRWRRV